MSREEPQNSESEVSSEEEAESEGESSSDEEYAKSLPTRSAYTALLASLTSGAGPHAKRRKLDHAQEQIIVEEVKQNFVEEQDLSEDDSEDPLDPFETHFADPDENILSKRLLALQGNQWTTQKVALQDSSTAIIGLPKADDTNDGFVLGKVTAPGDLKLHKKLAGILAKQRPSFDALEKSLAPLIFNYQDLLFCERSIANAESLRRLVCLHAINHVFK